MPTCGSYPEIAMRFIPNRDKKDWDVFWGGSARDDYNSEITLHMLEKIARSKAQGAYPDSGGVIVIARSGEDVPT
jgi:hypothetical protein